MTKTVSPAPPPPGVVEGGNLSRSCSGRRSNEGKEGESAAGDVGPDMRGEQGIGPRQDQVRGVGSAPGWSGKKHGL